MAILIPEIPTIGVGQATEPMIDTYSAPRRDPTAGSGMLQLAKSLEGLAGVQDRAVENKKQQDLANINVHAFTLKEGLKALNGKSPSTGDINNILSAVHPVVRSRAATDNGIEHGIAVRAEIFGSIPQGLPTEQAEAAYDAAISQYVAGLGDVDPAYKNGVLSSLNAARKTRSNVDYKVRVKNAEDAADNAFGGQVDDILTNSLTGADAGDFDDAPAPKPYIPGKGSSVKGSFNFAHADQKDVNADVLDRVSAASSLFGQELTIQSGYRSPAYNKKVGGAKNSQHVHKNAVDISTAGMNDEQKAALTASLVQAGFTRIIGYSGQQAIHVDMGNPGADGLAVMWNKSSKNMGSAADWYTKGIAMGRAGEKVAVASGAPVQMASAPSGTMTDVPADMDYGDEVDPTAGDPTVVAQDVPDVDEDGYPTSEDAYQDDGQTFAIGTELPKDESGDYIYSKNPKVNAAVKWARDQIKAKQEEYIRTSSNGAKRQRDVLARRLMAFAEEQNNPAFLHAIDFGILPKELKTEFRTTERAIMGRVRFAREENERVAKVEAERKKNEVYKEMDDLILSGKPATDADMRRWGSVDRTLPDDFRPRRDAMESGMVDLRQQSDLLDKLKKDIRFAIDTGQDPNTIKIDGLTSPSHRNEARQFIDDYVKTGGEVNEKYYEDRWNDASQAIWGKALSGALTVKIDPKIQDTFEKHLMDAVVKWKEGNPGKTLYRITDRQDVFNAAFNKVLEAHPAPNADAGQNGEMPVPPAVNDPMNNPHDMNNTWGFGQN